MAAIPLNLTLEQGTDFSVNLTVRNSDGTPLNLLGYTASSEIRKHLLLLRSILLMLLLQIDHLVKSH